jgi:uncharacterized membrane protein
MKFSTRQDIEAPIDYVFERACDFRGFERQALRRGIEIERIDDYSKICVGMGWKAVFPYRGKSRNLKAEVTKYDAPNAMLFQSISGGIEAEFDVELLPLSRNRTRVKVGLEMSPKSLPARLLVQSMKFAKSSLDTRFSKRIRQFTIEVEEQYKRSKKANARP